MMARIARVDALGNVVNVIEAKEIPPPEKDGTSYVVADDNAEPGGTYDADARTFTRKPRPPVQPDPDAQRAADIRRITEYRALIAARDVMTDPDADEETKAAARRLINKDAINVTR